MGCDVFISYKSETIDIVNAIVHSLEAESIRCWYAPRDLERAYTGENYYSDAINKAIHETKVVIAIVCDEMLNSTWCRNEMDLALDTGKIVIPYSIRKVTISNGLTMRMRGHHWIDAYPEPEKKFSLLVNNIKGVLNSLSKSSTPSAEPLYTINDDSDFDYEEGEMLYSAKEYNDAILSLSISAEKGNSKASKLISKIFYHLPQSYEISDIIWETMEMQAKRGFSHANFALHTKYYKDSSNFLISYDYVKKAASDKTNHYAFLRLGIHYGWGIGVKPNHILAKMWYEKAINAGSIEAYSYLGQEYIYGGDKIKKDETKAFELFSKGAEKGDTRAMKFLGGCYLSGVGINEDFDKAIECYREMIDKDDNNGYCQIGNAYWDKKQNYKEAESYFQQGAKYNEGDAFHALSIIYWNNGNFEEAYKWVKAGYQVKNANATERLADWYTNGDYQNYIKIDYAKAWKLYAESYSWAGRSSDAVNIAKLFFDNRYKPEDVSIDYILNILDISARNQDESAIELLVKIYSGDFPDSGILRNEKKIFEYTLLGAEGGLPNYMKSIAELYEKGVGVVPNLFKSADWLEKAVDAGERSALSKMIQLCKEHVELQDNTSKWICEAAKKGMKEYYMDAASDLQNVDPSIAVNYLKELDLAEAYAMLSRYYAEGIGVESSISTAIEYKNRALNDSYLNERERVVRQCGTIIDREMMASIENGSDVSEEVIRAYSNGAYCSYFKEDEIDEFDKIYGSLYDYELEANHLNLSELCQAIKNLNESYSSLCEANNLADIYRIQQHDDTLPSDYIRHTIPSVCKMFLQLKHSGVLEDYSLGIKDESILNICERDNNSDRQLFMISIVEVKIDLEAYELELFRVFKNCKSHDYKALAENIKSRNGEQVTEEELRELLMPEDSSFVSTNDVSNNKDNEFERLLDEFIKNNS